MQLKHSIDILLAESRSITGEQLEEARLRSQSSGLPIGRTLVLMGAIKPTQLIKAADLQRLVQMGKVSFAEAVQQLQVVASPSGAKFFAGRKRKTAESGALRVGELLMFSGVLAESNLADALEISMLDRTSIGSALVKLGVITEGMLEKALDLQARVNQGETSKAMAIGELRWLHRAEKVYRECGDQN